MHRLDHHNRVVHHNRNREHKRRECDKVHREADKLHHEECTHKSHRNGYRRNDSRSYVLKEDVYHHKHEQERLDERLDNLMYRGVEEVVVVHRDEDLQTCGQILLHFINECKTVVDNSGCI